MNRAIENNLKIKLIEINKYTHPVDSLKDISIVKKYLR